LLPEREALKENIFAKETEVPKGKAATMSQVTIDLNKPKKKCTNVEV